MLGLGHYLQLKGHHVTCVAPSEVPDFLLWLPGVTRVIDYENKPSVAKEALIQADLIFCLDFNDFSRVKNLEESLTQATQPKILMDHHMFPKPVWDYGVSNPDKSSTCEMVYDFINFAGDNALINTNIAQCLYTGTMTDTGSFRFPATTGNVHRMIGDFLDRGLKHSVIHEAVNDNWSEKRMRFVGYMLIERMQIFHKYNAGLITISREDLKLFGLAAGDTEGLVQYPMSIRGIRFSTLITERADEVKLSFRSKGAFDVNKFAREYFMGGGHFNASGGRSNQTFNETIDRFKEILSQFHPL
jgi:phosphoesterase RecJ-like protein